MEKYRPSIYCDLGFLESILSRPENSSDLDNKYLNNSEFTTRIRNLLLSTSVKLFLNITPEEYNEMQDNINKKRLKAAKKNKKPDFSQLEKIMYELRLKQNECGGYHLKLNSNKIQFDDTLLQDNYMNAMFFSCEPKEICEQAMKDYGIIVICKETIEDFSYLLFDQGAAIKKTEYSDWSKCLFSNHEPIPCNSLIIVDNYILNDNLKLEENLIPFFNAILPKELKSSVIFDITIFARLEKDNAKDTCPFEIEPKMKKVKEILKEVREKINFNLTILKCAKGEFHDRSIASANLCIGCGGGFDLFKDGKSQKTTTIYAFNPFFIMHNNWSKKAYSDLLNEASTVFKKSQVGELPKTQYIANYIYGVKNNRLLEQIID